MPNWEDKVREFSHAILHGDEEHRAWLLAATEAFINGEPIPPVKPTHKTAE